MLHPRATPPFSFVIKLVPQSYFAPLDLLAIFGRIAPLHADLGCGDASLLHELAQLHPDQNFLGIEKLVSRVEKACRKAAALENVRILNVESSYAVRYLLPENSIEKFYLLFPDPWPKRRHHRRRIVQPDFLESIHRALHVGGTLHVATDQLGYFQHIQRVVLALQLDRLKRSTFQKAQPDLEFPITQFERKFRDQGASIYRLALRKVSPVR
jgi:tRNA (guanine-N7-)-methyltransferase